jgi:hypothetical protein
MGLYGKKETMFKDGEKGKKYQDMTRIDDAN